MKTIFSTVLLVSLLSVSLFAQTNTAPTLAESAKAAVVSVVSTNVQPTLNSVMVEILSGAKDAGKEIYGASKTAIISSYDFIKEQTPDVIQQFLLWRFTHATIWAGIFVAISCSLFFFAYKLKQYQPKASTHNYAGDPSERQVTTCFKWIFIGAAFVLLIIGVGSNSFEMLKIKVAPKVYVIEYVVDLVNGQNVRR